MKLLNKYLISMLIAFIATTVHAASVDLSIDPVTTTIEVGHDFTVDILGNYSDGGNLLGGSLNLIFDPLVLNVTGVTIVAPDDVGMGLGSGAIDNVNGRVDLIGFYDFFGVSGDFTFATINFSAVGVSANSVLKLEDAHDPFFEWVNDMPPFDEFVIPNFTNGSVTVNAVPIPAAVWLLASGLGFFGLVRRREGWWWRQHIL